MVRPHRSYAGEDSTDAVRHIPRPAELSESPWEMEAEVRPQRTCRRRTISWVQVLIWLVAMLLAAVVGRCIPWLTAKLL